MTKIIITQLKQPKGATIFRAYFEGEPQLAMDWPNSMLGAIGALIVAYGKDNGVELVLPADVDMDLSTPGM